MARAGFAYGRLGALDGGFLHAHAVVKVDRVHFAEYLTAADAIADFDVDPLQTPGEGRADLVDIVRLDRTDTEQRRRDRSRLDGRGDDRNGRQRSGSQDDIDEQRQQRNDRGDQGEGAATNMR